MWMADGVVRLIMRIRPFPHGVRNPFGTMNCVIEVRNGGNVIEGGGGVPS